MADWLLFDNDEKKKFLFCLVSSFFFFLTSNQTLLMNPLWIRSLHQTELNSFFCLFSWKIKKLLAVCSIVQCHKKDCRAEVQNNETACLVLNTKPNIYIYKTQSTDTIFFLWSSCLDFLFSSFHQDNPICYARHIGEAHNKLIMNNKLICRCLLRAIISLISPRI